MPAVRNIYHMLAYAFRALEQAGIEEIGSEEFDHLHDLLAAILAHGLTRQVKQGLHRDYTERSEELAGVRGRIDVAHSIKGLTFLRARLACNFDEFTPDTLHNRILRSTALALLRHGEVAAERRAALRRVLPHLSDVAEIDLRSVAWARLHTRRASASYRLLLGVAEMVAHGLLPDPQGKGRKLRTFLTDQAMHALFERFVRAWYEYHRPDLAPGASHVPWALAAGESSSLLPQMRSDVTLRGRERSLIIDTKFYDKTLQHQARFDRNSYRSAHLYQIHAYVKNAQAAWPGEVGGMLLYAATDETHTPDEVLHIDGNRFELRTLDLRQPWDDITAQLHGFCVWVDEVSGALIRI